MEYFMSNRLLIPFEKEPNELYPDLSKSSNYIETISKTGSLKKNEAEIQKIAEKI